MGWLDWMKKRGGEVVFGGIAGNKEPSRTQPGLSDFDPGLKAAAGENRDDALSKMRSLVSNIANDHNSDWHEHWAPFEEAVLGVRKAFAYRVELLNLLNEGRGSKDVPGDAEKPREGAGPLQDHDGRTWER